MASRSFRVFGTRKDLESVFCTSTTINGYMILKNAYSKKEQLRFATIGAQSTKEYDLK